VVSGANNDQPDTFLLQNSADVGLLVSHPANLVNPTYRAALEMEQLCVVFGMKAVFFRT